MALSKLFCKYFNKTNFSYSNYIYLKLLIRSSCPKESIQLSKSFSYSPQGFVATQKFHNRDKIPTDFELIYRSPLTKYSNGGQASFLVLSVSLSAFLIYYSFFYEESVNDPMEPRFGPESKTQMNIGIVVLLAMLFCVQLLSWKIVHRVYFNGKQFVLVKNNFFGPLSKEKMSFLPGECKRSTTLIKNVNFVFQVHNKKVYILEDYFKSNYYFNSMIGNL